MSITSDPKAIQFLKECKGFINIAYKQRRIGHETAVWLTGYAEGLADMMVISNSALSALETKLETKFEDTIKQKEVTTLNEPNNINTATNSV